MSDPRYPIGRFVPPEEYPAALRAQLVAEIERAPSQLRAAVRGLTAEQLDHPYRDGGWTVRQVVHHLPDSHLNAYVRCKLAATEDEPTVRPYDEQRWAELPDAAHGDPELSLALLEALHRRWVVFLRNLSPEQWLRPLRHPDLGILPLARLVALYAWHGRHHVAHITALREREGW